MTHRVTLIPGDGVGPEVSAAARRCVEATDVQIEWDVQEIGSSRQAAGDSPLPVTALESIRERGVALKGPITTQVAAGARSANLELRDSLDLYVGIRPCRTLPGAPTPFPDTDIVVVRMLNEDLYAGIELGPATPEAQRLRELIGESQRRALATDAAFALKPISYAAARRVADRAFSYARENARNRVTAIHKATVMPLTDGLFLEAARAASERWPEIGYEEVLVDTACHQLIRNPGGYDVLLAPMLYGDVVSDLGAAMIGGLGLAPGANLGDRCAVFEPVHGSVPKRAGRNQANPIAMVLSAAMLLRHLAEEEAAARLEGAVAGVLREGRTLTYDLARASGISSPATTSELADAVVARL